ncbi:MAG: hypothetical protein NTY81_02635 [Candidatus Staskawiczbacteria bacterium]|nr:hypothetical protein [Candidatus Staskawiczbacteria bacterium]
MKKYFKIITTILISLVLLLGISGFADARIARVRGYVRKSTGTYVMPHYKTTPNKTKFDNFSTKGNINPFTGKKGTVNPFKIKF